MSGPGRAGPQGSDQVVGLGVGRLCPQKRPSRPRCLPWAQGWEKRAERLPPEPGALARTAGVAAVRAGGQGAARRLWRALCACLLGEGWPRLQGPRCPGPTVQAWGSVRPV